MTSLIIENFKCFKKQSVDLRQMTVLAGGNSVGKSSIVQALLLSRICMDKVEGYYIDDTYHQTSEDVKIPLNGMYAMALGRIQEVLHRNADNEHIRIHFANSLAASCGILLHVPQTEADYSLDFKGFMGSRKAAKSYSIGQDNFYYLNAERIGPRLRYEVEDTKYAHTGWNGELTIQVLGQKSNDLVPAARCCNVEVANTLLEQSRLWLKEITPGTRLDNAEIYSKIKMAEITLGSSRPTNVGFGLSYVLPIIVNGLIAKQGSMLIVENPEAHLHPSGQSHIGKFLAKIAASGVQVIIETHSEHVINGIRLAALQEIISHEKVQINFFDRSEVDEVTVTSIQLNEKADLTEWPNGFFDQQERDLASIFRLKRHIKL